MIDIPVNAIHQRDQLEGAFTSVQNDTNFWEMLEDNIKSLIKILEESNIDEMEVSTFWGKQSIRIRKNIKTTINY